MINKFLDFIKDTPTAFHAQDKFKKILDEYGFKELLECEAWCLTPGGKYYVGRNMSSIVAFVMPTDGAHSFNITAAHLDSPTFKLKPNFTINKSRYIKFNTEVYGGPIYNTWMDRPLGIAGRVIVDSDCGITAKLINICEPVVCIPNLPIHYNRNVNKGVELNPQVDMIPIFADKNYKDASLTKMIAERLGVYEGDILSMDLYLTVLDRGCLVGANKEFVMAPQIDNLECSFGCINALVNSSNSKSINVCALFDNEEIGSGTLQGAAGTMLSDVLERISIALGKSKESHLQMLANSFIVSADNAQGVHPNHMGKYDETNPCYLNEGIVIKNAARGSYSTDAMSSAYFQKICKNANVKYQLNTNRSDVAGGSTLGVVSIRQVSIPSVDIGLAELAMHSAYETAGSLDLEYLIKALEEFYNNSLVPSNEKSLKF